MEGKCRLGNRELALQRIKIGKQRVEKNKNRVKSCKSKEHELNHLLKNFGHFLRPARKKDNVKNLYYIFCMYSHTERLRFASLAVFLYML